MGRNSAYGRIKNTASLAISNCGLDCFNRVFAGHRDTRHDAISLRAEAVRLADGCVVSFPCTLAHKCDADKDSGRHNSSTASGWLRVFACSIGGRRVWLRLLLRRWSFGRTGMARLPVAALARSVQSAGSKPAGLVSLGTMARTTRFRWICRLDIFRVSSSASCRSASTRHYITWVYNRCGKTILSAALFHSAFNIAPDFIPSTNLAIWMVSTVALAVIFTDRMWRRRES
jgi:hypothetical protein